MKKVPLLISVLLLLVATIGVIFILRDSIMKKEMLYKIDTDRAQSVLESFGFKGKKLTVVTQTDPFDQGITYKNQKYGVIAQSYIEYDDMTVTWKIYLNDKHLIDNYDSENVSELKEIKQKNLNDFIISSFLQNSPDKSLSNMSVNAEEIITIQ